MAMLKECEYCGRVFETRRHDGKYCSPNCAYEAYKKTKREERMASKQLIEKVCPICGDTFFTLDNQRIYCSAECRERHKLDCAHNKKPKTSICKWCHKEFLRGDNYKLKLCPECRDKAIKMGVKSISENLDAVMWDDQRFIDRYGVKDVKAAREHEKMISADERVRRRLGIDTKQWGFYKDSHPDIFVEIRREAGIREQKS